jgi:hypothetical protein
LCTGWYLVRDVFGKCFASAGNVEKSISIAFMQKCVAKTTYEIDKNVVVFFTRNEIGKRNNAKNIELKRNLAVFSYVKRKFGLNYMRNEKFEAKISEKKRKKRSEIL